MGNRRFSISPYDNQCKRTGKVNHLFQNKSEFNIDNNLLMFRCPNFLSHKDKSFLLEDSNQERNKDSEEEKTDV